MQALAAQLKISEKMTDQLLHEKARLALRHEQLSNQSYLPSLVKNAESLEVEIAEQRAVNKRLNTTAKQRGDEIVRSQSSVVPAEKER